MRKLLAFCSFVLAAITFLACSEESNPAFDAANFTSIFNSDRFDSAYYAMDIKETSDGGYLVLARKKMEGEFAGAYILKANKYGNFVSHTEVSDELVNPVGQLMPVGELYYFVCMDADSKRTRIVAININGGVSSVTNSGISYPCAASQDGGNFIVLGYNHVDGRTTVNLVNPSGNTVSDQDFRVGVGGEDQVEEDVINHFFQYGRKLPFIVGRIPGGLYYFNGFYDYTFSLVFTDLNSENPSGLIQGQHDDGGFSAVYPLGGSKFAASIFNFGENYILPNQNLNISSTPGIAIDLGGFTLPELVPNANIRIQKVTLDNKGAVVFAGDTRSKQIGLWFYDENTKALLSSRYLGFSNPFEVGNLMQTSDGGLVICGTTYLAGRFPRITIFKISREELQKQLK
jgi:hypothetical protein